MPMVSGSSMPASRINVGCQKPIAYEPMTMPNRIKHSSQTLADTSTLRIDPWVCALLSFYLGAYQGFLIRAQPVGVADLIVQIEVDDDTHDDRRKRFDNKQPLPPRQPERAGK